MTTAARWQGFVAPLVTILFGAAVALGGSRYPIGTPGDMGPGFFPVAVGVALVGLGVAIAVGAALAAAPEPLPRIEWRPLVAVGLAIAAFALTIERAGFAPATVLLVLVACLGGKGFSLWRVIWLSALMIAGCTLVFIWGLGLNVDLVEGIT